MLSPEEFRAMHVPGDPFVLANAWDVASARWLHAAGHRVVGTTSLGVAYEAGRADGAGETADETFELAARIAAAGIPVSVDLEAGFSEDPGRVGAFAERLERVGVVGINIEDSESAGRLVEPEAVCAKIAAVRATAPRLFINARTDPFWIPSDSSIVARTAEAVSRARRYVAAGASGVFVPGAIPLEIMAALTSGIAAPVNVLVQAGVPLFELAEVGIARVSTGSLLFRVALGAIASAADNVRIGAFVPASTTPAYEDVAGRAPLRLE